MARTNGERGDLRGLTVVFGALYAEGNGCHRIEIEDVVGVDYVYGVGHGLREGDFSVGIAVERRIKFNILSVVDLLHHVSRGRRSFAEHEVGEVDRAACFHRFGELDGVLLIEIVVFATGFCRGREGCEAHIVHADVEPGESLIVGNVDGGQLVFLEKDAVEHRVVRQVDFRQIVIVGSEIGELRVLGNVE